MNPLDRNKDGRINRDDARTLLGEEKTVTVKVILIGLGIAALIGLMLAAAIFGKP